MYRRYMPDERGMLFDFGIEQSVMMWMKDTYIPLDMIFISPTGVVTHIHENAEPLSEAIISSEGPAFGVLEVNGGCARKIGLKPGSHRCSSADADVQALTAYGLFADAPSHASEFARRCRGIAQPGSAEVLGTSGRRFESCCPDHRPVGFGPRRRGSQDGRWNGHDGAIYRPSKNATQSGMGKTKLWRLDYTPESARTIEPLMGWTSSSDMKARSA